MWDNLHFKNILFFIQKHYKLSFKSLFLQIIALKIFQCKIYIHLKIVLTLFFIIDNIEERALFKFRKELKIERSLLWQS